MVTSETYQSSPAQKAPQPEDVHWRNLNIVMETLLSMGELQKDARNPYSADRFCEITIGAIANMIQFKACAIYVVESKTSDQKLAALSADDHRESIEDEIEFLIRQGVIAWTLRENRGITVFSRDGTCKLMLHVIATYARIRGVFIGLFPSREVRSPESAIEFLSLMLRSLATALESIEYVDLLTTENEQLQKQIEEKMRLLVYREREVANTRRLNAIASLAGGIAHEYNNALTSLVGYNDLITMDFRNGDKVLSYAEKMQPMLARLSSLTKQLLAYSRGGKCQPEVVALKSLVNSCLMKLKNQLEDPMCLTVRFGDEHLCVNGDANQLKQAFKSIIINAIEAIEDRGELCIDVDKVRIEDAVQCQDSILEKGDYALLQVRDTGIGMDKKTQERMFDPFFTTKFHGRGLGMAAVFGIVENHDGRIVVDSKLEVGTTVKVYLPAVEAPCETRTGLEP